MKYIKKRKRYENSTGTLSYDPLTKEAWSYGWYQLVRNIEGKLVFNWFMYSNATRKHQYVISGMLRKAGHEYISISNSGNLRDLEPLLYANNLYFNHKLNELQSTSTYYTKSQRESYAKSSEDTYESYLEFSQAFNLKVDTKSLDVKAQERLVDFERNLLQKKELTKKLMKEKYYILKIHASYLPTDTQNILLNRLSSEEMKATVFGVDKTTWNKAKKLYKIAGHHDNVNSITDLSDIPKKFILTEADFPLLNRDKLSKEMKTIYG